MKTKLLLSALLSFYFCLLSSQVPQGFNYQAIARDGSNPITTPIDVRITIQSLIDGGPLYVEEHYAVTPDESGLINFIIGNGVWQSGVVFSEIDWSVTPKYIKTEINYGSWKTMGAVALWSVPYSMVAKDIEGTVEKLGIKGTTSNMEEALFEVKNKNGQIVFAVYNEGVRIYVDDGDAKGAKGGFAIGGFGGTKTPAQNYFVVKPDTIRMYIDNTPGKTAKGGFAIGGFGGTKTLVQKYLVVKPDTIRMYIDDTPGKTAKGGFAIGGFGGTKGDNKNFLNVATDNSGIINPGENRILWYPLKNAFLTGKVRIGTPDSVGENSFATGYESKARGMYSQAMGFKTIANGDFSTAIGKNAIANTTNSFAFGDGTYASGNDSYAFGSGATAAGIGSYAFGSAGRDTIGGTTGVNTQANGQYSFAMGMGALANGKNAFSIGTNSSSGNTGSMALGYATSASNVGSTALGYGAQATGYFSISLNGVATGTSAVSLGGSASGEASIALGGLASAKNSISAGYLTKAIAEGSVAIGSGTWSLSVFNRTYSTANGIYSYALGRDVTANADYSYSLGNKLFNNSYMSFAFGRYADMPSGASLTTWVDTDPLFILGNGYTSTGGPPLYTVTSHYRNAMTVLKNGNTGIGTSSPIAPLHIKGNEGILALEGSDHCYIQFYPDTYTGGRKAYLGYPGASINDFTIVNGIAGGNVTITPGPESGGTGYVGLMGPTRITQSTTYDVWIQGGTSTSMGDGRNLAMVGYIPDDKLYINYDGEYAGGTWINHTVYLPQVYGTTVTSSPAPHALYINSDGKLGGLSSSRKYKENVSDLENYKWLFNLRPVLYNYKNTNTSDIQYGLIAEEVEKVNPLLVIYDKESKPDGLMYEKLVVPMLKAIQDQKDEIETLNEKIVRLEKLVEELIGGK